MGKEEVSPKDIMFQEIAWRLKPGDAKTFEKNLYMDRINYESGEIPDR